MLNTPDRSEVWLDYYTRDQGLQAAMRQYQQRHGIAPTDLFIRVGTDIPAAEVPEDLFVHHNKYIPAAMFGFMLPRINQPRLI